jgi:DNA-directed RNA polymerase subunit N (RpoN/RPB10)
MLFYVRCPSCGRVISHNVVKWYEGTAKIRNDPSLSESEKNDQTAELLKSLYRKICCRIRIQGLIPYDEIVITPSDYHENRADGERQTNQFLALQ